MGNRGCAAPSCTAIEFRETGYCHRHQDMVEFGALIKNDVPPSPIIISTGISKQSPNPAKFGFALSIFGLILIFLASSFDWICCGSIIVIIGVTMVGFDMLSNILRPGPRAGQHTIQ